LDDVVKGDFIGMCYAIEIMYIELRQEDFSVSCSQAAEHAAVGALERAPVGANEGNIARLAVGA
jgi:hypothetical protein